MYNYHLAMYILSPQLLYSDSESGSGNTQSSSCRSSQLRACAPSILHPVFFVPCPVTIVAIHSQLHHSSQLNWVYHPRCSCDDMFTIYQDLHLCLLFSLFILLHVKPWNGKKTQSRSQANADWNRLLPYSTP